MAESRQRDAWDRTSAVLCMIYNANRDPKKTRAATPLDFHPLRRKGRSGIPLKAGNIGILKAFAGKGNEP